MRRHLFGLALGAVMFLVMFFAGSWGYIQLLKVPAPATAPVSALPAQGGSLLSSRSVLEAVGAVLVTGLLAGFLIARPRISPLAAGLPGLLALGWQALFLVNVHKAVDLIPMRSQAFGSGWEALLFNGVLGAAGLAMAVPLLMRSRWRAWDGDGDEFEGDLFDAEDYVSGLKESMASANPPRPPALLSEDSPRAGRSTGGMPRASTRGMPRVSDGDRPTRTGLVGGPPRRPRD